MRQKVYGVTGPLASGKNTLSDYISIFKGIPVYSISYQLNKFAQNDSISRQELIGYQKELAKLNGEGFLAKSILEGAQEPAIVVLDIGQLGQVDYLKRNSDFLLFGVDANSHIRFNRAKIRGDVESWREFLDIERRDNSGPQRVNDCVNLADRIFVNNYSRNELFMGIEEVLRHY